jgi:hypothetical protein
MKPDWKDAPEWAGVLMMYTSSPKTRPTFCWAETANPGSKACYTSHSEMQFALGPRLWALYEHRPQLDQKPEEQPKPYWAAEDEVDWEPLRMENIGKNGNTGEHYRKLEKMAKLLLDHSPEKLAGMLVDANAEIDRLLGAAVPNEHGKNRYGLDMSYFRNIINRELNRPLVDYKPSELARVLARMSRTADETVMHEAEFGLPGDAEPVATVEVWNQGGSGEFVTAEGINKLPHGTKLYAHQPKAVLDGYALVPSDLLDEFPEINVSNYDHDNVCKLNAWGVEVVLSAQEPNNGI